MVGKTSKNRAMSPHTLENTCTHHTDKQRKAVGEGEWRVKTSKHSTQNAPSSYHTDLKISSTTQSILRNLLHVQIIAKPQTIIIIWRQSLLVVNLVRFHLTYFKIRLMKTLPTLTAKFNVSGNRHCYFFIALVITEY